MADRSYTLPDGTRFEVPEGAAPDKIRSDLLGAGHSADDINTALTKNGMAHYTLPSGETFHEHQSLHPDVIRRELGTAGYSSDDIDKALASVKHDNPLGDFTNQAKGYGKSIGTGVAKFVPDLLGSAISGATSVGGINSPSAATEAARQVPRNTFRNYAAGNGNFSDIFKYDFPKGKEPSKLAPNPSFLTDKIGKAVGGWHEPTSEGEKLAETATQGALGGLLTGPGGLVSRAGIYGAWPAIASEKAGDWTKGKKFPEWVPGIGGKDASTAASVATAMLAPTVAAKIRTPLSVSDPARIAATGTLNQAGIRTTAGQDTGREWLMGHEASAFKNRNEEQARQLTRAVTYHLGQPTEEATIGTGGYIPTVGRAIKRNMDAVAGRNNINMGVMSLPERMGVINEFERIARDNPQHVNDILKTVRQNTGWIPNMVGAPTGPLGDQQRLWRTLFAGARNIRGEDYQRLRSQFFSQASDLASSNPTRAEAYRNMARTLDTAMGHSIARQNPTDIQAFQNARQLLENNMIVSKARSKSGASDQINPKGLESAARNIVGDNRYNAGDTPYQPLATAAQKAMPPLQKSTTDWAHTGLGMAALGGIGAIAAPTAALLAGASPHVAATTVLEGLFGLPATVAIPAYLGSKLATTRAGQHYLRNQALPTTRTNRGDRAVNAAVQGTLAGQRQ